MKLTDQVCTLEQAKRLQELGIKEPSLFKWKDWSFDEDGSEYRPFFGEEHKGCIPAYTVAELGEMLPGSARAADGIINLIKTGKLMGHYTCIWEYQHSEIHPTEAQARAAMLEYLLSNKIISAEDVNKRLS